MANERIRLPDSQTVGITMNEAAKQLLGEPEQSDNPIEEPEAAEQEEQVEEVEEVEETEAMSETQTSDEGEDPDEDEEETEDEEGTTEEQEELDYYLIKVDGEEIEVTLDELRAGYQRQKDYTRKTQTIAEQRKEYETKTAELEELHQNFMNQATLANELLNRDLKKFESTDWDKLKTEDPVGYVQKQLEIQEIKGAQQALQQQAQQSHELQLKAQQEEAQKYLDEQRKETLTLFPEWKKQDSAEAGQQAIVDYARTAGYTDQELANIISAKDLMVLDKARQWDEHLATKKGITKKERPPVRKKVVRSKGAAPKGTSKKKAVKQSQDQFRKSGSLKDAAKFMHELRQSKVVNK